LRRQRFPIKVLVAILTLLTFSLHLLPLPIAQAQTPGLTMEVTSATDGYFKYGEWLPLWIQLENNGSDVDVEVQVRVPTTQGTSVFATPASLASGARKRVPLYVLPNNYSHELEVLAVNGSDVLASQKIPVAGLANVTFMFGLIVPEHGALSLIKGVVLPGRNRSIALANLTLRNLPDRAEGLGSFDALIINDVDTSALDNDQRAALTQWVRQGGRLLLGGGPGALRTATGLPQELLAMAPKDLMEVTDVQALAEFSETEPIQNPGPFTLATGDPLGSKAIVMAGNQPLLLEKSVGAGTAYFVTLDLSTAPFNGWPGTTSFWAKLIGPGATYPDWLPPDMSARQMTSNQMNYALSNLPALDLPSIRGLTILLGFYVIMVGPVNYAVLRWRKRLHWAWLTIPVLTITFSAGAFSLGYLLRGNDIILNKIVIANSHLGGGATLRTYFGLFSPAQQSYLVELNSSGLISPIRPDYDPWGARAYQGGAETVFVQGEPTLVRGLSVDQWSMQAFMSEGTWEDFGEIIADLQYSNNFITGSLRNNSKISLTDIGLVFGSSIQRIPRLSPGEEAQVSLEMPNLTKPNFGAPLSYRLFEEEFSQPMPTGISRELQLKQNLIDNLFSYGFNVSSSAMVGPKGGSSDVTQILMLGWFNDAPPNLTVSGRSIAQQTTGLFSMTLSYSFPDSGHLALPPGLIPSAIVEMPIEGGSCGYPGTPAIYLGRGAGVVEFYLPEAFQGVTLDKLVVQLGTEAGWERAPNTAVYNWDHAAYEELESPNTGPNYLDNIQGLVSDHQVVRVRISSPEGFTGACYYLGLGLEGNW
jgi:hypothetical protein